MQSAVFQKCRRLFLFALSSGLLPLLLPVAAQGALPAESAYWELLRSRYTASSENYADALLEEFGVFRGLYPRSEKSDSLEFLRATLFEKKKMEAAALASYLKLVYVYPSSPLIPETLKNVKRLAESRKKGITAIFADDNLTLLKNHARKIVDEGTTSAGGMRGYLDFLELIADAKIGDLARYTIDEGRHYLYRLDYDLEQDRVCLLIGNMYQLQQNWRGALLAYGTAEILVPYGDAVAEALLEAGGVYLKPLKNYEMSRRVYNEVLDKYPAELAAARASVLLSEVDEAEEHYGQAVVQLEDTAKRFPFPEIRMECYARSARLYLDRLNNPEKAVASYERLVEEYPQETRSLEALSSIGDIQEKRLKNYPAALGAYCKISELSPESPLAPRSLLQAAELAEGKAKDSALADSLYQQLAQRYPQTEYGKKAAKKVR